MPGFATENTQLLMMMLGIGIFGWLMMRGKLSRRSAGTRISSRVPTQSPSLAKLKYNSQAEICPSTYSGIGSVHAPADALQWQLDLHDLGRELKAELDCKLIAVRSMTEAYDRASRRLMALIHAAECSQGAELGIIGRVQMHHAQGWTAEQIANEIGLSETDVVELLSIS